MNRSRLRRRLGGVLLAVAAVVVPAGLVWACVAPVSLTTVNNTVQPGGTVRVIGREMAPGAPVEIRLNSATGPILTTVTDQPGGMSSRWEADVVIPANTPYGRHTLYGVQNYRNMNAVVPKATIYVGTVPDPAPTPEPRAGFMDVGSGPSALTLVLVALGAAGAGLFIVGVLSLASSSRRSGPEAQRVKAS